MNRILVIEDNDTNYLLVEEILSEFKVELTRAINGKEFYHKIKKILMNLI